MGRCMSLGSLKCFLRCASRTSVQSTECYLFFSILNSAQGSALRLVVGCSQEATVADGMMAGKYSLFTGMAATFPFHR